MSRFPIVGGSDAGISAALRARELDPATKATSSSQTRIRTSRSADPVPRFDPARPLGPALVAGELGSLWIYLTAPILGGIVGAFICERVNRYSPLDQRC
jgi:hypothetical protein